MTIGQHVTTFAGKRVVDFALGGKLEDPATTVPRIRVEYDDEHTATTLLTEILQQPRADELTGLVVGAWVGETMYETSPAEVIETLVAAADQLASLRAIFLGDITYEENEISWIHQCDQSPLLAAFPNLELLQIRGSQGLSLGQPTHAALKTLIIECGGLPVAVVREIAAAQFPSLEHLELYLGSDNYGWDGTAEDLQPLLSGELFPRLKYLGLRDSEVADEVARVAAQGKILERLEVLDLSLGNLTDEGAEHLLNSPGVKKLKKLDLHHHFCTNSTLERLQQLPIEVDASDTQEPHVYGSDVYRFIAVSE
jgi:hypothetical protein